MELKIIQQEALQPIEFNFDELKQQLTERLKFYTDLTYTEDEIRTAKTDRATLNKFKEAIENRRKEIKKAHMKPYETFEKKIKEIVRMIDEPILAIDGQVKSFENRVKEEKRAEITKFYEENVGDLKELLPLYRIWNEKWLNATVSIKSVSESILKVIAGVKNDLEVISNLNSEFELQIKDVYLRGLNLSAALQEKARLEESKAKLEAYKKAMAETKSQEEDAITIETEVDGHTLTKKGYEAMESLFNRPEEAEFTQPEEPELIQIDFRVWATSEQLQALKEFLKANNIRYGRVTE